METTETRTITSRQADYIASLMDFANADKVERMQAAYDLHHDDNWQITETSWRKHTLRRLSRAEASQLIDDLLEL